MSLLEKAIDHHASVTRPAKRSLLERAEKYRKEIAQNPIPEDYKPLGLLQKAETLLEQDAIARLDEALSGQEEVPELEEVPEPTEVLEEEKSSELDDVLEEEPQPDLPSFDEFDLWEEEARVASEKTPIQPKEKDPIPAEEGYLFDDESDYTTAPIEYHLASKKKIENYQAIFEITKEIAASSSFDEFFSNLNYSIIGQVGAETLGVFSSTNGDFSRLDLLEYHGFEPTSDWFFHKNDETYNRMLDAESVVYAGEILSSGIPDKEKKLLEAMDAEILAPIRHADEFYGFIVLGRLISGEEYITDDLEFIKILADIAGSVFKRVSEFEKRSSEIEKMESIIQSNGSILSFSRDLVNVRKLDSAYDLLIRHLKQEFYVSNFTFMIFDPKVKDEYKVFSSNQLSPSAIDSFRLGRTSDIIGMVSNVMGVYQLDDFQKDPELLSLLSNDEIGIMEEFTLIPMINLNWLVGIFIVHKTEVPWTNSTRETILSLFEIVAPVFANILILDEKENSFRNPFSPIEDRLDIELKKAEDLRTAFTVVVFKVQNIPRMIQILGHSYFAEYCDTLRKSIQEHLGENDHYIRVGQGKFAAIFHSKDKEESEIVIRKIKNDFHPEPGSPGHDFKPSYRILSLEYPRDSKIKEQFLEMIEEA